VNPRALGAAETTHIYGCTLFSRRVKLFLDVGAVFNVLDMKYRRIGDLQSFSFLASPDGPFCVSLPCFSVGWALTEFI